ncbi:MAG: hypothetical protein DHS20C11_03790 [Lysobacteraceae bacterium]|nr:MAG: hypothetical protein DHS20C11_03790 [Xanthomonadaceae bacterium]
MQVRCGVFYLLLVAMVCTVEASELAPFTTDGCSSFPDGTFEQQALWLDCCTVHDLAYWQGGTREQRMQADEALRECVANVGEPTIAKLMLAGVRVGGTPYLPTRFRWGYGWPFTRGYTPLNNAELEQIASALAAAGIARPGVESEQPAVNSETENGKE